MSFLHVMAQPWYSATLAVAMRLYQGQNYEDEPLWIHCHATAGRLCARFRDATQDQVEAALLQDVLMDPRITAKTLRAERVRPAVIRIVESLTRPTALEYLDFVYAMLFNEDVDVLRILLADAEERVNSLGLPSPIHMYADASDAIAAALGVSVRPSRLHT